MVWHYTVYHHFVSICNDGFLRPARAVPPWEKPIVWFSTESLFEETSAKLWRNPDGTLQSLRLDGMLEHKIVPMRIGVDVGVAPITGATSSH